jgi:putative transposase
MLRRSIRDYLSHYHLERNHQGIGNRTIVPLKSHGHPSDRIHRKARLGGVLNFYQRLAA